MERHSLGYNRGNRDRRRARRSGRRRFWLILSLALLVSLAVTGIAGGVAMYRLSRGLPDVRKLATYQPNQTTEIYSSDGLLLARLFDENREVVPLSQIPPDLRKATIAIEDHRFFSHRGVDWHGTMRALVANFRHGGYVQGGSTITQQLVRNVFLSPDKNLARKVKESILATRVERFFNKQEILGMYLNQVYYGERCFGVEAASRRYFGKSARRLTLAEAALLAGIPQRPGLYDPYANLAAARDRRNRVLSRMAQVGFLSPHQAWAAMKEPVRLAYTEPPRLTVRRAGYFVDYVVRQLEDRYGAEMLFRGGLKVQTTLNTRAQEAAERAVANGMNGRFGRRSRTQAALVSIDPTNGYIRAMVGGRSYARSVFNRAAQAKRQPGSSFKPFVYAAAMGSGYTPMDRITDAPVHFAGMDWHPKNYDGRWHGTMTLTQAFAQSVNIPAIKLLNSVGPGNVIKLARACGIESPLGDNLSLALGTSEVSVLEIAGAYGAFATGGDYTPPIAIVRVRDGKGRLLESNYPNPETVLDEMVARRMDFMLRQVVRVGTGRPAASVPDARGKTGTTNDLKDAWFVGYTPSLVTAVWVGNDHPSRIPGLTGGGACAPIWVAYMQRALRILPSHPLPDALRMPAPPQDRIYVAEDGQAPGRTVAVAGTAGATAPDEVASDEANYNAVSSNAASGAAMSSSDTVPPDAVRRRVCLVTGQLATRNCPETDVESFARGTEPTESCTLHGGRTMVGAVTAGEVVVLCRASGGLAGPNCTDLVTMRLRAGARLPGSCRIHSRPAAREAAALATLPFPGQ